MREERVQLSACRGSVLSEVAHVASSRDSLAGEGSVCAHPASRSGDLVVALLAGELQCLQRVHVAPLRHVVNDNAAAAA
eukprot:3672376-Pleurochrysis_carterae.AAC.1